MLLVPSTRLRADRFKNIYVCDWIIRAWTVESEAGAISLLVLVVDPRLFRASVVPLDRLTVRLWLTWQVVRTPRSDVTVFQPQPRIPCPSICLVQQRGFIVADISRSVCPFLSVAPCRGSVAGRRRPGGVWSAEELIQMKTWSVDLQSSRLNLWPTCSVSRDATSCTVEVQEPGRFSSQPSTTTAAGFSN